MTGGKKFRLIVPYLVPAAAEYNLLQILFKKSICLIFSSKF